MRRRTLGKNYIDSLNPDEVQSVDRHLFEFDIKDMIKNETGQKQDFLYSAATES